MKKLLIILALFFSFQALASDADYEDYIIRLSEVSKSTRKWAYKTLVGNDNHEKLFLLHLADPWKAHRQLVSFLRVATTRKKIRAAETLLLIFPE